MVSLCGVTPAKVLAFGKNPYSQTRYRFASWWLPDPLTRPPRFLGAGHNQRRCRGPGGPGRDRPAV